MTFHGEKDGQRRKGQGSWYHAKGAQEVGTQDLPQAAGRRSRSRRSGRLLANRYDALATVPNTGNPAIISQWGETQPYTLVFQDQNGAAYVRDGADGSMLVEANLITSVGAARGAGTVGASTTTAGIKEALNSLPASGGKVVIDPGNINTSSSIELGAYCTSNFSLEFVPGARYLLRQRLCDRP